MDKVRVEWVVKKMNVWRCRGISQVQGRLIKFTLSLSISISIVLTENTFYRSYKKIIRHEIFSFCFLHLHFNE